MSRHVFSVCLHLLEYLEMKRRCILRHMCRILGIERSTFVLSWVVYLILLQSHCVAIQMMKILLILVALLCGIGHDALVKMCAALNCPPPSNDEYFSNTLPYIQLALSTARDRSCTSVAEEAITKQGTWDIMVSTDGN